jgi:hypothetical protein
MDGFSFPPQARMKSSGDRPSFVFSLSPACECGGGNIDIGLSADLNLRHSSPSTSPVARRRLPLFSSAPGVVSPPLRWREQQPPDAVGPKEGHSTRSIPHGTSRRYSSTPVRRLRALLRTRARRAAPDGVPSATSLTSYRHQATYYLPI